VEPVDTDATGATVAVVTEPATGTLVLNQDGSFSYTTPTGFTGQQTFTYSVTNQFGNSEAQVTIGLAQAAWFVNNSGAAGDGSQASPFTTLKAAETASAAGDTIFVFGGDCTDSGQDEGIVLKPNQLLLSERQGLIFQNGVMTRTDISAQLVPDQIIVPADPGVRPVISNGTGIGDTKTGGSGGGIDLRPGRDPAHQTTSQLTIAQNTFTAIGSNERGIQIFADGADFPNTIDLTVVSDGETASGFSGNGLLATALGTSELSIAIRGGNFTGGADEGIFIEGVETGATICAQVLNNTFDAFRIRPNAGQNPLIQLEALPPGTTLDTNTGMITVQNGVTLVNLDACGLPATPAP
jgi:hypothetical protein